MTPERWAQIQEVFDELVTLEPPEQARRLALVSDSDPELGREVESLLDADGGAAEVLDPIQEVISSPGDLVSQEGQQTTADPYGLVGRSVSHYEVTELLGGGGMGVLYLAADRRLDRTVVLKFLPPQWSLNVPLKRRFLREARAAAALEHPNVCTIHEVGDTEEDQLFIAMPFYEGETVREKLSQGPLSSQETINLTVQAARGLRAAHAEGIVHRDIKPANLMVTTDGTLKILDFGLAKTAEMTMTGAGVTLGTVSYMSPEQTRGETVDERSDLWSLGVTMYEMLTGQTPFGGDRRSAVIHAIRHDQPQLPSELSEDLPPELEQVVLKLLSKDPEDRCATASELAEALATGELLRPGWKRGWHKLRLVAYPAAFSAALFGAVFVGSRFTGAPEGPAPADPIWILVKPFTFMGDEEEEYLAEGLVDDVRYRLSSVASLRVIARQSSMTYRETSQNVKEIGDELGVDYILDGLVRGEQTAEGNRRIRLTVALASTEDGSQVWSDAYDKPASLGNLLDMQTTIASQVAAALNLVLSERERLALIERETDTLALYYFNEALIKAGSRESQVRASLAMFLKALEVDSTFVRAWGGVAASHGNLYHFGFDRSRERLASWKAAADRAMELDPEFLGPLVASRYHYLCCKDYERALAYIEEAGDDRPGIYDYELKYPDVLAAERFFQIALIQRRMGAWDEAIANWQRAIELDPREPWILLAQGQSYGRIRRFEEAIRYLDLAIDVAPDFAIAYADKASFLLTLGGDTQAARRVLEDAAGLADQDRPLERVLFWVDMYERDYRAALDRFGGNRPNDRGSMVSVGGRVDIAQAKVHELVGDQERARIHFDSARIEMQTRLTALPPADSSGRANVRILLAEAYAGLGLREEALLEAAAAEQLMPVTRDALNGPDVMLEAAYFHTQTGNHEAALDRIEHLLSIPSTLTTHDLRLNPFWDPLRGDPRFQALLEPA